MKSAKINKAELIFLLLIFGSIFVWAYVQPFDVSPDERMRFEIVRYIVEYNKLPVGYDPAIRDANWGISYAFNPIMAYMIMAIPVKLASFFTEEIRTLAMAARMVNVLLGTGTAFLVLRIGDRLFDRWGKWIFAAITMLLPGTIFVFSYVNNDGLALFSVALMILFWSKSLKEGWTTKNCIGLAVAISICALAYYNAYGAILSSVIFFIVGNLLGGDDKGRKWNFWYTLKFGILITLIVFLLAGWWFIRSYYLYDGDFLGMKTSSMYAQKYALEAFKPTNRYYYSRSGESPFAMWFFIPEGWEHNWIITVAVSFVGTFGYMTEFMPFWLSKCYLIVFLIGIIGCFLIIKKLFGVRNTESIVLHRELGGEPLRIKITRYTKLLSKEGLLNWCMLLTGVIPFFLLMYYSYTSDYQAQGRYLMPGLISFMYFVTRGIEALLDKTGRKEKMLKCVSVALIVAMSVGMIATFFGVFLPNYLAFL